jgi:hypothetical protein
MSLFMTFREAVLHPKRRSMSVLNAYCSRVMLPYLSLLFSDNLHFPSTFHLLKYAESSGKK